MAVLVILQMVNRFHDKSFNYPTLPTTSQISVFCDYNSGGTKIGDTFAQIPFRFHTFDGWIVTQEYVDH